VTQIVTPPTTEETRRQIKAELPEDTFARQPQRALWFIPLVATVVASATTIIVVQPAWYLCLLLGVVMGQCFAAMGFLAHEVLHGSVVKSKGLQYFLGYLGFGPVLVSPSLWRVWHNQVHHGKTNMGNADPDSFGTVSRYEKAPSTRFVARLAPGSRHWSSAFFFAYWFTFHGQVVLWIQAKYMRGFARFNRRRAIIDSAVCLALWVTVGVLAGPFYSLFVVLVPLVVTNFLVMSYIATNHFMRPMTEANDPIENSMSVTTLPVIDRLHFNFSHHVEHHLFPMMSAKHAPRVRGWLEEHEGDRYVSPNHVRAFTYLYRTPRVYLDANTLVDPERPDEVHADIRDVTAYLVH
jgi:fatty acid desaturase